MEKYVIIVAGGSGARMQSALPKQFIKIGHLPVLMHTILRFYEYEPNINIILVLPDKEIESWKRLCSDYLFQIKHQIVAGGSTRFDSVHNGLSAIKDQESLVAIHDGVRPFVPVSVIQESFEVANEKGNAIASVISKDSVRRLAEDGSNSTIDRDSLRIIQTPQTFQYSILKSSFDKATHKNFTDDASVVESAGFKINLTEGAYINIKITTPEDLLIAESFLKIDDIK